MRTDKFCIEYVGCALHTNIEAIHNKNRGRREKTRQKLKNSQQRENTGSRHENRYEHNIWYMGICIKSRENIIFKNKRTRFKHEHDNDH